MIFQRIKSLCTISLVMLVTLLPVGRSVALDACNGDCVLRSAADDQSCAIEKTPLVRCEKFEEFRLRDSELNVAYKSLYSTLKISEKSELKNMQRKWIQWRDETCDDAEAEANCANGMCVGVAHDSCVVRLTERRLAELNEFKKNSAKARAVRFDFSKSPTVQSR